MGQKEWARKYRMNHKESIKERNIKYRKRPKVKKRLKEYHKKYAKTEKRKKYLREYYQQHQKKNREEINAANRKYRKIAKERLKEIKKTEEELNIIMKKKTNKEEKPTKKEIQAQKRIAKTNKKIEEIVPDIP